MQYVTEKRAYLDRGAKEGLAPKQSLQLFRGGRAVGSCAIETLADHQATCVGGRPRAGDNFRLPPRSGAKKRERDAALPPIIDEETLRTRADVVSGAPYEKVDFNGVRVLAARTHGEVSAGFMVWHTSPDPNGDYSVEELDGTVQVYDLGATGIDFNAAFTAMRWGARAAMGRFQPTRTEPVLSVGSRVFEAGRGREDRLRGRPNLALARTRPDAARRRSGRSTQRDRDRRRRRLRRPRTPGFHRGSDVHRLGDGRLRCPGRERKQEVRLPVGA